MLVVAFVGSRDYPELSDVTVFLAKMHRKYPDAVIVSGGARGVDTAAERVADKLGYDWISYRPYEYTNMAGDPEFSIETVTKGEIAQEIVVAKSRRINPPHFKSYGQAAFFRNKWIVDDADRVVAFTTGSRGTADTLRQARAKGIPTHINP
jgi:hypothetical protein